MLFIEKFNFSFAISGKFFLTQSEEEQKNKNKIRLTFSTLASSVLNKILAWKVNSFSLFFFLFCRYKKSVKKFYNNKSYYLLHQRTSSRGDKLDMNNMISFQGK